MVTTPARPFGVMVTYPRSPLRCDGHLPPYLGLGDRSGAETDTKATVADHVIVQDVAALLQHGTIVSYDV